MSNRIPISNLYYLLCYAWNKLEESEVVNVDADTCPDLINLFGRVLASGTSHLLRRGVHQGYVSRRGATRRPRGRIDFPATFQTAFSAPGSVVCEFEELSHNVLRNQILRSTIRRLAASGLLESDLRRRLRGHLGRMRGIDEIEVTAQHFRRVQLDRNSGFYIFLLNVCALVHAGLAVDSASGRLRFRDFDRDERRMAFVFQQFVRNFLRAHAPNSPSVSAPVLEWRPASGDPRAMERLPRMETDIVVRTPEHALIIDTKYYYEAFQRSWGKETVRSAHLYQMLAYLQNFSNLSPSPPVGGMLMYPAVTADFHLEYQLLGFPVAVASVDLNRPWPEIHSRIVSLVSQGLEPPPVP